MYRKTNHIENCEAIKRSQFDCQFRFVQLIPIYQYFVIKLKFLEKTYVTFDQNFHWGV